MKRKKTMRISARLAGYTLAGLMSTAIMFQPMTVLAGPAGDMSLTAQGGGPGSGSSSGSGGSGSSVPASGAAGFGVGPTTSGLGTYRVTEEAGAGAIARGVDVSYWQQEVDWNQVSADNVQFAMLATRFRGQVDPFFAVNADSASKAGLRLGAYIYSYATTPEMAEQEADFVLNLIKDYPISFPVVFDAEDAGTLGTLSPSEVSDVINAFCRKIAAAGYYPMVYANEYWIANKIDMSKLNHDIWVARYNEPFTYSNPAMWQATNTGSVKGVEGNVDIDYLYKDFTQVIPANTWRNIGGKQYYYQNHVMQRSAWIHDGANWYYMNGEGNPSTGWLTLADGRYFLENDGKMVSGWKEMDGVWRYFDPSGQLASGWRDVNGTWYYLDSDGRMQTGWQQIQGSWYYLDGSGAMQTGWMDRDGARCYLSPETGAMAVSMVITVDGVNYQAAADGSCTVVEVQTDTETGGETGDGASEPTEPTKPAGPAGV